MKHRFLLPFLTIILLFRASKATVLEKKGQCVDVDAYFAVPDEPEQPIQRDQPGNCGGDGWTNFTRPSGEWCIKIFYEDDITQAAAEKECQAQGATLSGFQNMMEVQWAAAMSTIGIYPRTGSIWVGLKRREDCLNVGRTKNCTGMNSFQWTDRSASGTDGMLWSCGQPDNSRLYQHCAVLQASPISYLAGFQTGTLDDVSCELKRTNKNMLRAVVGYVCGRRAQ
ncbi:unnamed protein product [Caenorhabditis sp. 36 PRJEB53466]|nr:unnamed protein product [Caenorhabditis sp. 36 PRJEB53466]